MDVSAFLKIPTFLMFLLFAWSVAWKGIALWNASKNDQKNWFIVILILNTFGIIEIIYLFVYAKKKLKLRDLFFWKSK